MDDRGNSEEIPDVCIIGAGLAGGILAYELASRGLKLVVLEAGPRHDLRKRFSDMEDLLFNNKKPWASNNPERDLYTNAGAVKYPLERTRVKAVGGTTLHWGGLALRLHETDFRMRSLYGLADDWPITYDEVEAYYGKAEVALGVSGIADNPFASYRSTDYPLPPFPFSYADKVLKKGWDKAGITMHHIPWARNSVPYQDRPACHAFGTCGSHRICPIVAQYTSEGHIGLAERTGRTRLISDASVLRINVDGSRRVTSVIYATPDKIEHEQKAICFVLAAHAVESARLLLLSKSIQFPDGLANSSGLVGKNFMEHLSVWVEGQLKERLYPYRIGFGTAESQQFYVSEKRGETGAFRIGAKNNAGPMPANIAANSGTWGAELEEEVKELFGRKAVIVATLEQLPDESNSISLDPTVKDCFGNPAPRITYSIGDYERRTAKEAVAMIERVLDALDATEIMHNGMEAAGDFVFNYHHLGTCRMGRDPKRSVVDRYLRAHDVTNLFIVGSSVFPTGGAVQPSLTIAALAIRCADYITKEFR